MKRRDFVASRIEDDYQEVNLFVLTDDYKNFALYEELEKLFLAFLYVIMVSHKKIMVLLNKLEAEND